MRELKGGQRHRGLARAVTPWHGEETGRNGARSKCSSYRDDYGSYMKNVRKY
jgi:hypothetical protein